MGIWFAVEKQAHFFQLIKYKTSDYKQHAVQYTKMCWWPNVCKTNHAFFGTQQGIHPRPKPSGEYPQRVLCGSCWGHVAAQMTALGACVGTAPGAVLMILLLFSQSLCAYGLFVVWGKCVDVAIETTNDQFNAPAWWCLVLDVGDLLWRTTIPKQWRHTCSSVHIRTIYLLFMFSFAKMVIF